MSLLNSRKREPLEALWRFSGDEQDFWLELLRVMTAQLDAASGVIFFSDRDNKCAQTESGGDEDEEQWSPIAHWPEAEETRQRLYSQREALAELAERCWGQRQLEAGNVLLNNEPESGMRMAALPLHLERSNEACVVVFLRYGDDDFFQPSARDVQLMKDTPLIWGANPLLNLASNEDDDGGLGAGEKDPTALAINLSLRLDQERRFLAAAMTVCNELAAGYHADRVSLGWRRGDGVKLIATSHVDRVSRKSDLARYLSAAMEECVEQDDEIVWPPAGGLQSIDRDHEAYSRREGVSKLASIPLRVDGDAVAVITLEREAVDLCEDELDGMRLVGDMIIRRLDDLKKRDRWFGAKLASGARKVLAWVLGVEHTWTKLLVVALVLLAGLLAYYPWPYKIEAPFQLRVEEMYHIPAPYDGYLKEVEVEVGDQVKSGQVLANLDDAELTLHVAELSAAVERNLSEAKLAKSDSRIGQMQIALAKVQEAKAQLMKVQYSLDKASVISPIDGVVVEGDLKERLGYPVQKGEALFKVGQIEGMYAEFKVSERNISEVKVGSVGELSFASRPGIRFAFEIKEIEPVALPDEGGNQFIMRVEVLREGEDAEWWRPGMSGLAKIDAGERSPLWIFTHRAVDFLRLKLWW